MELPVTVRQRELNRLWLRWRMPVLTAMAVLVGATLANVGYQKYAGWSQEQRAASARGAATDFAAALGEAFGRRWSELERALEREALARALAGGDAGALAAAEARLAEHPDVLAAHVVRPGEARVDYSTSPPFSYAALDLLRRSARSEAPLPPEVHLFGSEDQYVALARGVRGPQGELLGQVLLALDVSLLGQVMASVPLDRGYAELRQVVPAKAPLAIAARGDEGARSGRQPVSLSRVRNTDWQVAFWVAGVAAAEAGAQAGGALVWSAVGAALLGLPLGWVLWRRRGAPGRPQPAPGEDSGEPAPALREADPGPAPPPAGAGIEVEELEEMPGSEQPAPRAVEVPESIFRAYDVRGVVGESLDADIVREIGRAIGSEAHERGQQTIVVAVDGRESSAELGEALIEGLRASGRDIIDIGRVPTPVLYFATHYLNTGSGVMVTGSHNPPQYNGLKIMLAEETLFGDDIAALRTRIQEGRMVSGEGERQSMDIVSEYVRRVSEDVPVVLGNAYKVVVDCGNGVAGEVAPKLLRALGHDVVPLYCAVDGRFPNHHPDPSQPENLQDLIRAVKEHDADIGFAFDGDGDRLGVVDARGNIIWPDRQMMLYARDVLAQNRGAKIVYDVKCSNRLAKLIRKMGGEPLMCKTGHSFIKSKLRETGALLAGEMSGHIFIKDRWYGFDDALYAAARMLEILLGLNKPPAAVFARLPAGVSTPELRLDMEEGAHLRFMQRLVEANPFPDGEVTTIDGIRVDYPDGWGLVRASNTTPCLVLRFEGDDESALERIETRFREALLRLEPELSLPF